MEGDLPDDPTVTFEYHLHQIPAYVKTSAREIHHFAPGTNRLQDSFTYSDGFGRIVMQKVQAEDGPVPGVIGTVSNRWVGTGRTVYNNKGNPIKQYETFFSTTSDYESETAVVQAGVTPIIHYDPLDRVIQTDLPNGTFSKVVFDAWHQENWDPNDTVLESDWYKARTDPLHPASAQEQRAAQLAAKHAQTQTTTHLDSLGRVFLTQADNGPDPANPTGPHCFCYTKTKLDIEGNQLAIYDARQIALNSTNPNPTIQQQFDVLGRRIEVNSGDPRLFVLPSTGDTQVPFAHRIDGRGSSVSRSQRALAASISGDMVRPLASLSEFGASVSSCCVSTPTPRGDSLKVALFSVGVAAE